MDKTALLEILEHQTARDPFEMGHADRARWAQRLALVCERLADISRRRANELEGLYWSQAEEAMRSRRPRLGLGPRPRGPLDADEVRRARINAGILLGQDSRFKDACAANEMYGRWSRQYAALAATAAQLHVSGI